NRPLRKDCNRISNFDVSVFCAREAGAHDVRTHQDMFIGKIVRDRREVRHCMRHTDVLGLATVECVSESPSAHGLAAALCPVRGEACMALSAGRDRAHDDALSDLVPGYARSKFLDYAHSSVPDDASAHNGI